MAQDAEAATIKPAPGGVGLLIVDMINPMDFEDADALRPQAEAAADVIFGLRGQADRQGVPIIYVNDNFGQWHSERDRIIEHAGRGAGAGIVQRLRPRSQDYFITKPQVSAFYASNLPVLLPQLGVDRVVLTGMAADICILFTAADAHMRSYGLWVPQDAVASSRTEHRDWALEIMRKSMQAETRPCADRPLRDWISAAR